MHQDVSPSCINVTGFIFLARGHGDTVPVGFFRAMRLLRSLFIMQWLVWEDFREVPDFRMFPKDLLQTARIGPFANVR